jgi:hypothetical protein
MSAVGESLNVNPGVDFKVFMDMQMQALATEPSYAGLGGIQEYHAGYADEETVRWSGRLFRHYAIEGKTSLLSRKYGFKYALDHVRNPDFADGIKDWQVEAAEPGSMAPKKFAGYGYIQFRYSKKDGGDTFLWMKRNARKPNVFSQEIRNLKAGQLYSLKMVTGDYQDLVQGRMVKTQLAISLSIDNVEILPGEKSAFDRPFPQHYARGMGAFDGHKKNYWMNYHWRVFRTKGASATLTVSDWAGAKDPGGPAGQELVFNFIEVQPYLGD